MCLIDLLCHKHWLRFIYRSRSLSVESPLFVRKNSHVLPSNALWVLRVKGLWNPWAACITQSDRALQLGLQFKHMISVRAPVQSSVINWVGNDVLLAHLNENDNRKANEATCQWSRLSCPWNHRVHSARHRRIKSDVNIKQWVSALKSVCDLCNQADYVMERSKVHQNHPVFTLANILLKMY